MAGTIEAYFLAVIMAHGAFANISLINTGGSDEPSVIELHSMDGATLQTIMIIARKRSGTTSRIDLESEKTQFAWIDVRTGKKVRATIVNDLVTDKAVTETRPNAPVFRHPPSMSAIREGILIGADHQYTHDAAVAPGASLYFFLNLSPYPVKAGACAENYPGCLAALDRVVKPLETVYFPIDPAKRFAVIHSSLGFSAATPLEWTEGMRKLFGSDSAVIFDSVK